jgi:hypothetical protein
MEGDEHEGDTDEEIVVDSAPVPVQARAPKVIEISNEEQEEEEPEERQAEEEQDEEEQAEEAEELKQGGGGDPGDHLDPEGSDPKEEDPDDQDAEPEKLSVVVYHHDGGYARFPSMMRRLFHRLNLPVKIDYMGPRRTHPCNTRSGRCLCTSWTLTLTLGGGSMSLEFTMP